jgi:hypothetical protein
VSFVEHVISGEGVAIDPEKVKAVVEWTRPTNVFKIKSFLRLAGYYQHFIEDFLKLSGPLADVNPVKNNETQQRKGTQDRSMDRFEGMTSTRCL